MVICCHSHSIYTCTSWWEVWVARSLCEGVDMKMGGIIVVIFENNLAHVWNYCFCSNFSHFCNILVIFIKSGKLNVNTNFIQLKWDVLCMEIIHLQVQLECKFFKGSNFLINHIYDLEKASVIGENLVIFYFYRQISFALTEKDNLFLKSWWFI